MQIYNQERCLACTTWTMWSAQSDIKPKYLGCGKFRPNARAHSWVPSANPCCCCSPYLQAAGVGNALNSSTEWTILAPTNEAFTNRLQEDLGITPQQLLQPANRATLVKVRSAVLQVKCARTLTALGLAYSSRSFSGMCCVCFAPCANSRPVVLRPVRTCCASAAEWRECAPVTSALWPGWDLPVTRAAQLDGHCCCTSTYGHMSKVRAYGNCMPESRRKVGKTCAANC